MELFRRTRNISRTETLPLQKKKCLPCQQQTRQAARLRLSTLVASPLGLGILESVAWLGLPGRDSQLSPYSEHWPQGLSLDVEMAMR